MLCLTLSINVSVFICQKCGNVLSWKRVQGASGKLQAFGFCEFEEPEATLRCMRLLNDWLIADRKLVVRKLYDIRNIVERKQRVTLSNASDCWSE